MESDERPNKVRKLSHDTSTNAQNGADEAASVEHRRPELSATLSKSNDMIKQAEQKTLSVISEGYEQGEHNLAEAKSEPKSTPAAGTTLSKNQLKKLRKQQEWDAGKDWRRTKRKEKTKERKQRQREQREQEAKQQKSHGQSVAKPRRRRPKLLPVTFVIDCGFDDKMMDKERISLGSQITRSYSDNSRAPFQAHLMVSSWGGLLKERFDTVLDKQWVKWKGIRFAEDDFVTVSKAAKEAMSRPRGGKLEGIFRKYAAQPRSNTASHVARKQDGSMQPSTNETADQPPAHIDSVGRTPNDDVGPTNSSGLDQNSSVDDQTPPVPLPEPQTIYLTSDSPHTLTTLEPYSTYIIGGLVDKNRHKGICYRTAMDRGMKTAKLPIGEYMEMSSRFVLATNHVVEIMVRYLECGDWGEAFMKVVPKRKGGKLKEKDAQGEESHGNDDDEDDHDSGNDDAADDSGFDEDGDVDLNDEEDDRDLTS